MQEQGAEYHGEYRLEAHDERGRRGVRILLADYLQCIAAGRRHECLVEKHGDAGQYSRPGRPFHYKGHNKAGGAAEQKLQLGQQDGIVLVDELIDRYYLCRETGRANERQPVALSSSGEASLQAHDRKAHHGDRDAYHGAPFDLAPDYDAEERRKDYIYRRDEARLSRADRQKTYLLGRRADEHEDPAEDSAPQHALLFVIELRTGIVLSRKISAFSKPAKNERRQYGCRHKLADRVECHRRHDPVSELLGYESGAPEYCRQQQN